MKDKKKIVKIVFGIVCVLIITVCIIIQIIIKNENKKLEKESQKYETLVVETLSGNKIETEYTHIDNKNFYIKIPKNFKALDYETIIKKYNGDVPNVVFSNDETTINIAISTTENKMNNRQIKGYIEYMNDLLKDYSEIVNTKFYEVDNHNIGQIKLISNATDTKIYNNMICFSYDDKLVIITFNCTEDLKDEWSNVGDFIIDSLFFKE